MSTRTVRLDDETEKTLNEIRETTGLSISAILKKGLTAYKDEVLGVVTMTPYDVYRQLDLGPGGHSIGASTNTKQAVRDSIKRKINR